MLHLRRFEPLCHRRALRFEHFEELRHRLYGDPRDLLLA